MNRSLGWQPLLLIIATMLAIGFAAGGWALGRRRSQMGTATHIAGSSTAQQPQATNNANVDSQAARPAAAPDSNGVIALDVSLATRSAELRLTEIDGRAALSGWSSPDDTATWQFRAVRSGFYRAELT